MWLGCTRNRRPAGEVRPNTPVVQDSGRAYCPLAMDTTWERIQSLLEKNLKPGLFQVWIKPLTASAEGDRLDVRAPNEFVASWVRERLQGPLVEAATSVMGCAPRLRIVAEAAGRKASGRPGGQLDGRLAGQVRVAPAMPGAPATGAAEPRVDAAARPEFMPVSPQAAPHMPARMTQAALPLASAPRLLAPTQTSWRFSFEDFVVGPCNELAFAASKSLSRGFESAEQLFLCSAPGLGKTHLLQAVGRNLAEQTGRPARVACLTAEEFATKLVMAIKAREMETFKSAFRGELDALLLEDVHFLQGKERIQEELLSTLKTLSGRGCRIVLTSSFLPKELTGLDSQLLSRLGAGFLAVIDRPDPETRMRILETKAFRKFGATLPRNVACLLADRLRADVRQLESCLQNLILKAQLLNRAISMDLALEVLQNYELEALTPSLDDIALRVSEAYGVAPEALASKSRRKELVQARNAAFFLARKHTDLSLKDIGCRFNRKHSTVLKGIVNLERELAKRTPAGRQMAEVLERLENR